MIRKQSILMFLLFLSFYFFFPNVVLASEADHKHIYMVEGFKINGSIITLNGYSFISHQDNYGFNGTIGNLKTYIVAYKGDWSDDYAYVDRCNDSTNCYSKKMTVVSRDMFYTRCLDNTESCNRSTYNAAMRRATEDKLMNVLEGEAICNTQDNACLYYDVGFSGSIDLKVIFEELGSGSEANFKIVSTIGKNSIVRFRASDLSVYNGICKVGGNDCGANIVSGDYKFSIGGFSKNVNFDATWAAPRDEFGTSRVAACPGFWTEQQKYKILKYTGKMVDGMSKCGADGNCVTYSDTLVQLDSVFTDDIYYQSYGYVRNKILPPDVGVQSSLYSGCNDFWALASWVTFDGGLKINGFEEVITKKYCNNISGFEDVKTGETVLDVDCDNSGSIGQCERIESIENVIYAKIDNGDCPADSKIKIEDNWYAKVKVSTALLFNQVGNFKFGKINPGVVYAGKGFSLGETTYSNTITWMVANVSGSGQPHYKYSTNGLMKYVDGGCADDDTFDPTKSSSYYYYNNDKKEYEPVFNFQDAAWFAISESAKAQIKTNKVNDINFVSCDSNGDVSCDLNAPDYGVVGSWNVNSSNVNDFKYNGVTFGKKITNTYSYNLANSYVIVVGDEIGKAEYVNGVAEEIEKKVATGKKFYIDFKWDYSKNLPFNLAKNEKISFLDFMDWTLNGTCSVEVKDGYYKDADGDKMNLNYKYRPISLNNPFPKANGDISKIPINWRNWYFVSGNSLRIKDTFNRSFDYLVGFSKLKINNDIVSIEDIKSLSIEKGYGSFSGFNNAGTSEFLTRKFSGGIKTSSSIHYCKLGFFSKDCNKYLGEGG